jgi:hypothetical protein
MDKYMEKVGKTPKRKECSKTEGFRLINLIFQYSEKQVYKAGIITRAF